MMWALDWLEMETEVDVEERRGRTGWLAASSPSSSGVSALVSRSRAEGGGAEGTGRFPMTFSLGGVCKYPGVADADVLGVWALGERFSRAARRFCAANSAASEREMADGLLRADLKENLGLGANVARVSWNLSCRALMAWDD
jgi:hypothetical protein